MQPTSRYSLEDLQLLAEANIDPESLVDATQRMSIENRIISKEVLGMNDTAILELLLRHAEIDSGIHTVDPERQAMVKKKIQEGKLMSRSLKPLLLVLWLGLISVLAFALVIVFVLSFHFRLHVLHGKEVLAPNKSAMMNFRTMVV